MTEVDRMSDYDVAVAFERTVIYEGDIDKAMQYAHPYITVNEAPSTPYRRPIIGADGLRQLREDVNRYFVFEGEARTRYFVAEPGLVVGTIERDARLRHTTEPFSFRVTEWIRVTDGLVSEVDVYYFENAPLARAADAERARLRAVRRINNDERSRSAMRDFDLGYPVGWFQIGWSSDFPTGVARPVRAFGDDLVVYRGSSGEIHALNGHCPHMGAHLGYGGRVEGDALVCPFHGWVWDETGGNVSIPDDNPKRAVRVGCRYLTENSGLVLVWHDPQHTAPEFELPPLVADEDMYHPILPDASKSWDVGFPPHVVAANAIDSAHFVEVHKAGSPPAIMSITDDGPFLRVKQEIVYGAGKKQSWLTPDGPRKGELEITLYGLGLSHTKFLGSDEAVNLVAVTPVDFHTSIFRMTNWVPRETDFARRVAEQFKQAERDFVIWENMQFIGKPPLMRSESQPYLTFKRWSDRLYPGSDAETLTASAGGE